MRARRLLLGPVLLLAAGCGPAPAKPAPEKGREEPAFREVRAWVVDVIKESGQAAIDAGRRDGVRPGSVFAILRRGVVIGRVRVDHLWEKRCGGRIIELKERLKKGDRAVAVVATRPPRETGKPPAFRPAPGTIHTRLLEVRAKARRAVLGAGSAAGVKVGKVFYVYRGDRYIGRAKVVLVKPQLSGARIVESREKFKPGDRAVYDPADERRDSAVPEGRPADPAAVRRELEAKIKDPETSKEERAAAREVLKRLRAEGAKEKKPKK